MLAISIHTILISLYFNLLAFQNWRYPNPHVIKGKCVLIQFTSYSPCTTHCKLNSLCNSHLLPLGMLSPFHQSVKSNHIECIITSLKFAHCSHSKSYCLIILPLQLKCWNQINVSGFNSFLYCI